MNELEIKIKASELKRYDYFRKCTGEYIYKVMSESSIKMLELDNSMVYGVSYNGNITSIEKAKFIVKCDVILFVEQIIKYTIADHLPLDIGITLKRINE